MIILQACNNEHVDIDNVIDKYDNTDFTELQDRSIYFRSTGNQRNASIYFVNKLSNTCSPYAVEFNNETKKIVEIRNHLVILSCGKDYLSNEAVESAIRKYLEYKLCLVQVDAEGNVYINPDKQALPILLRKAPSSSPANLYQFRPYKGNWYIRR